MAEKTSTDTKSNMVISPSPHGNIFKLKKFWIILFAVLLLVAGGYFLVIKKPSKKSVTQPVAKPKTYTETYKQSVSSIGVNKPQDSVNEWNEFLKTHPSQEDQFNGYRSLGVSYLNAKQYDQAEAAFKKALSVQGHENDTDTLYAMGHMYEEQGKTQLAIDTYKKNLVALQEKIKGEDAVAQFQTTQDITSTKGAITRLGGTL